MSIYYDDPRALLMPYVPYCENASKYVLHCHFHYSAPYIYVKIYNLNIMETREFKAMIWCNSDDITKHLNQGYYHMEFIEVPGCIWPTQYISFHDSITQRSVLFKYTMKAFDTVLKFNKQTHKSI